MRLFAGDRIFKILDRLGPVDDEGEEIPLEAKMLTQAGRERPEEGRGAELPDPQASARVRRRDERAAPRRLQVPARGPRGPRHGRDRPRADRRRRRRQGRRVHASATSSRNGTSPGSRASSARSGRFRSTSAELDPQTSSREQVKTSSDEDALERLRRARGGVRRGADARAGALDPAADHRQPLEGAPRRDGLPARGHPPARLRPDRSAGRLQERGLHDVPGADGLDLGGVRASRSSTSRSRSSPIRSSEAFGPRRRRAGGVNYSGGTARGPAVGAAAGARRRRPSKRRPGRRGGRGRRQRRAGEARRDGGQGRGRESIGRNDPCWCGSGKKYKKCHGA